MIEEKCDHVVGIYPDDDGIIEKIKESDNRLAKACIDFAFKFCPLCGVEIEGVENETI